MQCVYLAFDLSGLSVKTGTHFGSECIIQTKSGTAAFTLMFFLQTTCNHSYCIWLKFGQEICKWPSGEFLCDCVTHFGLVYVI